MIFIKVENLTTCFGQCNYRHLDIDQFVAGSQLYSDDMSTFMGATNEEQIEEKDGVTIISQDEYLVFKQAIEENTKTKHVTLEEQVDRINTKSLESEQAILELSTIIGGLM